MVHGLGLLLAHDAGTGILQSTMKTVLRSPVQQRLCATTAAHPRPAKSGRTWRPAGTLSEKEPRFTISVTDEIKGDIEPQVCQSISQIFGESEPASSILAWQAGSPWATGEQ